MKSSLRICWFVFAMLCTSILSAEAKNWPTIQPTQGKHTYVHPGKDGADTPLLLLLKNAGGVPLYKLECHNGNYEDSSELNFSGDFQCALFAIKDDARTSWNLLATGAKAEQRSDWLNRGRMTANQLWGQCGAFPEYGRIRHFKLRGMRITFRFTHLQWSTDVKKGQPQLERFTFAISVVPDKSARTATADTVEASTPPKSCN